MTTISERWLDPEQDRPVLEALPVISAFIPVIEASHEGLITKQVLLSSLNSELSLVQEQLGVADEHHDRYKRGVYYILTGLAEVAEDRDSAADFIDLRDRLLPLGLGEVRRSYVDEIGDANRLRGRLDDDARAFMASLSISDDTIETYVERWLEAADEMRQLNEQRIAIELRRTSGESRATTQAEAHEAKLQWIRMVRALEANLALESELTDELRTRILGPIKLAEAEADRRVARRNDGISDGESDTDAPDETAPAAGAPNPPDEATPVAGGPDIDPEGTPGEAAPAAGPETVAVAS